MSLLTLLLFLVGFFLLIKGADWMVEGAAALARKLKVSDLAIGLTIVSFGTSAPEFVVNIIASLQGNGGLAIGNILGSNIANVLLILGIAASIRPLVIQQNTIWKEIPLSLLSAIILGVLVNDRLMDGGVALLGRGDGIILISFFIIFMYYTFGLAQMGDMPVDTEEIKDMPVWKAIVFTVVGLAMLPIGGQLIVDGAIEIAELFGVSDAVIGIVIVGVGTSLPEVAASAVAAYKGRTDIAIGNAVGSNIFNIFWVLGVSSIIKTIPFDETLNGDVLMTIFASLALFLSAFVGKARHVGRGEGVLFLLMYVTYIVVRLAFGPL